MGDNYLKCPNCGNTVFFVQEQRGGGLIFMQFDSEGRPVYTQSMEPGLEEIELSEINCTGCAWYGRVSELTAG